MRDALFTFAAATMAVIGCSGTLTLAVLHVTTAQAPAGTHAV